MEKDKNKVLKYFEIKLFNKKKWDLSDYIEFIIENTYSTIVPFFIGYILAKTNFVLLVLLMILPIYVKFRIKRDSETKSKRIYVK